MAISITTGSPLSANESAPGIKNLWVNTDRLALITPNTGGPVTAFTTESGSGSWVKLECANGEGDATSTGSAGSGGYEWLLGGNYRIGGVSQAKLDQIDTMLKSSRVPMVIERDGGKFELATRNGVQFGTSTYTTGVTQGGAAAIGSVITFNANDVEPIATVIVATTLAAITDA